MPKVHTVQQGETLLRIAQAYGFTRSDTLYNHPSNAEFRALRPDPFVIYPGDKINIPEKEKNIVSRPAGSRHVFTLGKPETEQFIVNIQTCQHKAWEGKRVKLIVDEQVVDTVIGADGEVKVDLPKMTETEATLEIFLDDDTDQPTDILDIDLNHLDPPDTPTGIQARINNLGFDCGAVDGDINVKSEEAILAFQEAYGLKIDGDAGPITQGKLKDIYSC